MWVCDFHHIVVEQLQVAVIVNNVLVTTSVPGCVSETDRYFFVRVVQILFYDVQKQSIQCLFSHLVFTITT